MAALWNLSQAQLYDQNGTPMVSARAYFFLGGTTTPITTYAAFALGSVNANPNPVVTDGFGRWPSVFLDEADEFYRVRVTSASGVVVFDVDGLPIIGPSGGGGGGDNPVNPTAVFSTGDIKARYDTNFIDGWVRLNGRTIGTATSGATERANADTQALFEYLWDKNSSLVVVGGRGASAHADWLANKQITLPDGRGRTLVGLDTMGNTAGNVIPGVTSLGWLGGEWRHVLTTDEMPSHKHGGTTDVQGDHTHPYEFDGGSPGADEPQSGLRSKGSKNTGAAGAHSHNLNIANTGGGLGHNNVQPSLALTLYIKL